MIKTRKKTFERVTAFIVCIVILTAMLSFSAFAEMGMITENVPDTDIGGATGGASEFVSEMASELMPDEPADPMPRATVAPDNSASDITADENTGAIFGVVIAVIVVIALIMVIVAFVPKRGGRSDDQG